MPGDQPRRRPARPWSTARAPSRDRGTRPSASLSAPHSGRRTRRRRRAATIRPGPTRSAAAVVPPARLADRLARSPRRPAAARRLARSTPSGSAMAPRGTTRSVRGVPGHVGVVPHHDGRRAHPRRVDTGRAEEVVPLEQDGLGEPPSRVDSATTPPRRLRPPVAVDLSHRQHPVAVGRGAEAAVVVRPPPVRRRASAAWARWRRRARSHVGSGRPVAEPHPLVRLVHVGEGTTSVARHQAERPSAVLVDPAADADLRRRMVARPVFAGAHEDDTPASAGRDSSQ